MSDHELDVWIGGRYAGVLVQRDAVVSFGYDPGYQHERYTPALSASMPKSTREHHGDAPGRWIDNLLPDNDAVRERWAAGFGERRATAFGLLRHMGQDCAGAVQIMPAGVSPDTAGDGTPVSVDEIEKRVRMLRRDDSAWDFGEHGGRWSLGGAQGKFALARQPDGKWVEPTGRAASTHIVKVGIQSFAHSDVAEFVTMHAAQLLGLRVAHTKIVRFGSESALVSERYDRSVDPSGTVTRVHQEDICQALGLSRAAKYEADGGPGIGSIGELLRSVVDPRDLRASKELFALAIVYNWLVAGTDAHAKNYSLVHLGPRIRLAPLYDVTSAAMLLGVEEVEFKAKLAMKVGGHYKIRDIQGRHLQRAADAIGVDPAWLMDSARRLASELPQAVQHALDEASDVLADSGRHEFHAGLHARVTAAARTLRADRTPDVAQPPRPGHENGDRTAADAVWIAAHSRAGKPVPGYWRRRPAAGGRS